MAKIKPTTGTPIPRSAPKAAKAKAVAKAILDKARVASAAKAAAVRAAKAAAAASKAPSTRPASAKAPSAPQTPGNKAVLAKPRKPPSPAAAIGPNGILGAHFAGPSWDRWRAVLKAAYGEKLTKSEAALFREVADRDPPTAPVRELWCVIGRRGGKDSIASAIAAVAATGDYSAKLRPGEPAVVMCLASTKDQATIVFRYVQAYFDKTPALKALVISSTDTTITLSNRVEIIIVANSFRAVRGKSVVVAILDEVAFYRSDESANPDTELFNALEPAMSTFPNALMIGISSPYRRKGLLFDKWTEHFGKDDADVLVVRGASRVFNETLRQEIVDRRLAADPEAGAAEYMAEWRNDLSDFLDRELVESAVDTGVRARPPQSRFEYRCFVNSSGGRGDAFTASVAHAEGDVSIIDATYERKSPFNPSEVVKEVADFLRSYGITRVTGDKYAANWTTEAFAKEGIGYENSERDRSKIYLDCLPLFTSGRVRLLDHPRTTFQFVALERRVSRFGKDGVNHPAGGSDDLANATAGAAVLIASDLRPAMVRQADLLDENAMPFPLPALLQQIISTVAVSKDKRKAAVIYLGIAPDGGTRYVLDYDAGPIGRTFFTDIIARLNELAKVCGAWEFPPGIFAPVELHQPLYGAGWRAEELSEYMLDVDGLLVSGSVHISNKLIKLCEPAHLKAQSHPFGGALDLRAGDDNDDPLRTAALWAISLSCDSPM